MKKIDKTELLDQIVEPPKLMTRQEKLLHWAHIVRNYPIQLRMYFDLEHLSPYHFAHIKPADIALADRADSILSLAVKDPVFQRQGLSEHSSISDVLAFVGVTTRDLHGFACGCHGNISNEEAAYRLQNLSL